MIAYLRVLHSHAAKRGDGLRTEFLTHLGCGVTRLPSRPADAKPGRNKHAG